MTQRSLIAAAALAATFALSAAAADAPRAERPAPPPDAGFDFNFNFDFDFDLPALLADATGAPQAGEVLREHAERMKEWAEGFAYDLQGSMAFMFSDRVARGKVVKGAPYSADIVSETNQALADGNVITHQSTSRVYRDSEGRTRQETTRGDKVRSIYISDPVAGVSYTLLPGSKLAVSAPRHESRTPRPDRDRMSGDAPAPRAERRVVVRTAGDEGMPGSEEVRVKVIRIGENDKDMVIDLRPPVAPMPPTPPAPAVPPVPPLPPMPALPVLPSIMHSMRFESTAHLGKGVAANLGTKNIEGVKAEGKSTTWTIPAGQVGNRKPIQVVSESWYSPELQATVYSRYSDPRTGESIYRLAGVKRAEPAADLFKVPEDYKLRGRRGRDTPTPPAAPAPPAPEPRR